MRFFPAQLREEIRGLHLSGNFSDVLSVTLSGNLQQKPQIKSEINFTVRLPRYRKRNYFPVSYSNGGKSADY